MGMSLFIALAALITTMPVAAREQRRPCGPGTGRNPIRLFIPQSVAGADFRPACRQHDREYEMQGTVKADSDRAFYERLCEACQHSRRPRLCQFVARSYYWAVTHPLSDRFFEGKRPNP